jgi:PAS domain S-box-containing protein
MAQETKIEKLIEEINFLKEQEKELRQELSEWKDFAENAAIPLHWVNGSGIVIWANQAELDLLGFEKSEFVNQHISKFHADKEVCEDILKRLIRKETLIDYPSKLKCKNGEVKDVLISSNGYWRENQFVHTRCFTREVTGLNAKKRKESDTGNLQKKI